MKIKTKLILAAAINGALIAALGLVIYFNVNHISNDFAAVSQDTSPTMIYLGGINEDFLGGANSVLSYALTGDGAERSKYQDYMDDLDAQKQQLMSVITSKQSIAPAQDQAFIDQINLAHDDFMQAAQKLFADYDASGQANPDDINALIEKIHTLSPLIHNYINMEKNEVNDEQTKVAHSFNQAIAMIILLGALVFLFVIIISIWIFRSISRPLGLLCEKANAITQGSLTAKVEIKSKDEFSKLAEAFNAMTKKSYVSQVVLEKMMKDEKEKFQAEKINMEQDLKEKTAELKKVKRI